MASQVHPFDEATNERLLGMLCKPKEDGFTFRADLPKRLLTRQGILSALSRQFDPLGFVSLVLLKGKLFLQELCKRKADWEEPVTPLEAERLLQWTNGLPSLSGFHFPRCFKSSNLGGVKRAEIRAANSIEFYSSSSLSSSSRLFLASASSSSSFLI